MSLSFLCLWISRIVNLISHIFVCLANSIRPPGRSLGMQRPTGFQIRRSMSRDESHLPSKNPAFPKRFPNPKRRSEAPELQTSGAPDASTVPADSHVTSAVSSAPPSDRTTVRGSTWSAPCPLVATNHPQRGSMG